MYLGLKVIGTRCSVKMVELRVHELTCASRVCSVHVQLSVHLIRTLPMSRHEITYCKVALKWKADAPPCRLLLLLPLPSMVNHSVGSGMRSVAPGLNATTPGDGFLDCVLLVLTECVQ